MSRSKARVATNIGHWCEKLLLVGGLTAIGIWAASYSGAAAFQKWQEFVFECRLRGDTPSVANYGEGLVRRLVSSANTSPATRPESSSFPAPRGLTPAQRGLPIAADGMIGRLTIPRLHIGEMVREGDGEKTLSVALGHIPGTALPGQNGNVGVAGHRDTLFRGLRAIGRNDRIRFQTLNGSYDYQVESIEIVRPDDIGVLASGGHPELTLVTCYPFYYVGPAPDRFVVKARQVAP
jgi:sortase A